MILKSFHIWKGLEWDNEKSAVRQLVHLSARRNKRRLNACERRYVSVRANEYWLYVHRLDYWAGFERLTPPVRIGVGRISAVDAAEKAQKLNLVIDEEADTDSI